MVNRTRAVGVKFPKFLHPCLGRSSEPASPYSVLPLLAVELSSRMDIHREAGDGQRDPHRADGLGSLPENPDGPVGCSPCFPWRSRILIVRLEKHAAVDLELRHNTHDTDRDTYKHTYAYLAEGRVNDHPEVHVVHACGHAVDDS